MVAGDCQAAAEAEELIPHVTTAAVKETISRSAVKCLTPEKAGRLLKERTAYAIQNRDKVRPLTPPDRPVLSIEFANYGQAEWANLMRALKSNRERRLSAIKQKTYWKPTKRCLS